jgi:WD40 repeat protein
MFQIRITGSRVGYVDFQDVLFDENGQLLLSLRSLCWLTEYTEKLSSGALSPNGQTLASGGYTDSNIVQVWRVADDTLLHKLEGTSESRIKTITFSPDGQKLAVGTQDGLVHLWRILDGELLHTLKGHTDEVSALAFSPDGQILASGGDIVQVWQVSDGELLHTLPGVLVDGLEDHGFSSLTFSPDGQVLASGARGSAGSAVRLRRVSDGELLLTLMGGGC